MRPPGSRPSSLLLPSGERAKDSDEAIPSQATSFWKSRLMDCDPLSWRMVNPVATPSPMAPKHSRTPWRTGSNASKRVPRVAACLTCATRRTMVDRHEHADLLPVPEKDRRHVRAPHLIDPQRHDGSIMSPRATLRPSAWLGKQAVLAHQSQNPRLRGTNLLITQACSHFAIALAMERTGLDHLPDLFDRFRIGHLPAWAGPEARGLVIRLRFQTTVYAGETHLPDSGSPARHRRSFS